MKIKPKQILAVVTAVGVVTVTIYSIKKYHESKKQLSQSIGVDEAKHMVAAGKPVDDKIVEEPPRIPDRISNRGRRDTGNVIRLERGINAGKVRKADEEPVEEEEPEEEEAFYEGDDPEEIQDSKGYFEEDKDVIDDLRYDPNSIEAREQFINMELANLGRDNDTRDIVSMLYDQPFVPTCDEDKNLKLRLIDHRVRFFGLTSKWNNEVGFGDLIMYYAKAAEYNCGENTRHWAEYFLDCSMMNELTITSEEMEEKIGALNKHTFFNDDLQCHGLFGLSSSQFTEAIIIAKKRVDEKVTYDIEFHQFVQGIVQA